MSRQTKLKFAALLTAAVTTLGSAGIAGAVGSVDAGKISHGKQAPQKANGSWCC